MQRAGQLEQHGCPARLLRARAVFRHDADRIVVGVQDQGHHRRLVVLVGERGSWQTRDQVRGLFRLPAHVAMNGRADHTGSSPPFDLIDVLRRDIEPRNVSRNGQELHAGLIAARLIGRSEQDSPAAELRHV